MSLAIAANSAHQVAGVKALAVLSGAEYKPVGGGYFAAKTPPLLVVQSEADQADQPACGQQLYDAAPTPKYYLDLSASHTWPPTRRAASPSRWWRRSPPTSSRPRSMVAPWPPRP